MAEFDPFATQRGVNPDIAEELGSVGFEDAREIGRGGFGVVYRCRQPSLDRVVAVKVLTADLDPENLERFLREQHAMGRLSGHPNVVHVHGVGTTESGRPYIAMQYHPHNSLDARIRRYGPLTCGDALHLGVKVAGALEAVHRLGTLHRDVKPANILLTEYGEPQLTDFGIARVSGGFETSAGAVLGSPAFTAPEVLRGLSPTPVSDVYSLGATLFCAITGHAAFERRSGEEVVAQFLRITNEPAPDLRADDVPGEVCAAIEQAMSGDPADRPASAIEFGEILREAQRHNGYAVDEMALPIEPARHLQKVERSPTPPPARKQQGTTPPIPSTRFRPPTPVHALVARDRLIDILRAGQLRRLIVIHAPTGFGKSTLATQWRDALTTDGVKVAWLTVDHDDNNVVWFLAHLIEAIRVVQATLAEELGQVLEERGNEAEQYVLTSLINEIHEAGHRMAVVIDDWDRVGDHAAASALAFLLDHGCHHLQIVVTSRNRSHLPLSRMRVRDELIEIDLTALRFTTSEAQSLLDKLGCIELGLHDIARLTTTTDGWAAALQLAALSLRGNPDPIASIGQMSGRHHAIGEYLAENVLERLDESMLDFLLATSVPERICGSLASALAQVSHGEVILEEIESLDLFLRSVDESRTWFQYHTMFAEYLRRRLERDRPDKVAELHRTASTWFAGRGLLREAVDHALAAGDKDRAVELVDRGATNLLEHSQMSTLLGLVGKLSPQLAASKPRLQLVVASANILLRRSGAARTALGLVESALAQSADNETDVARLRVAASVIRGAVRIFSDRIDGVDELISECLSKPEESLAWIVSTAADIASFLALCRFDFDGARRWQEWATPYHLKTTGPFGAMYGFCFAGIAAHEQLDIVQAEDNFRQALQVTMKLAGAKSCAARLAGALLGDLLYERGDIDAAEKLLDECYETGGEGAVVDIALAVYGTGSRIKALRGEIDKAAQRLDVGEKLAEVHALPRLQARIVAERIRWGLQPQASVEHVEESDPQAPSDVVQEVISEIKEASHVRSLMALQSTSETKLLTTRVQEFVTKLEKQRRPRAVLQANILLGAILSFEGRTDEAKDVLAKVASRCSELGLVRFLVDGGPYVVSTLALLEEDQSRGEWKSDWPAIPRSFLTDALVAAQSGGTPPF
ncbi:hypothetical protein AXA44_45455 [Rhodococcus sp. SC4]|nr:hypothetical protein AXA44_45455 [Rhodococcus sp. SC4]